MIGKSKKILLEITKKVKQRNKNLLRLNKVNSNLVILQVFKVIEFINFLQKHRLQLKETVKVVKIRNKKISF